MEEKLKPCPFCGGEADYSIGEKGDGTPWDYVECLECGATTEPEVWNRRTAGGVEQQVQPDNGMQDRCKKDANGHCAFYPLDCKTCVMPLPVN